MHMDDQRSAFDLPDGESYFNAAQIGPLPRVAAEAGARAFEAKLRPWRSTTQTDFFDTPEALRAAAAGLFGAAAGDVALIPAASYGLAVAAANIPLTGAQEILVLDGQFPSNVYTWRRKAQDTGARVRTVARRDGQSWTEALLDAIGPQTGLVACAHLHWIDGGRIDLEAVSGAVESHGAALVLDLTQSLGVMAFDRDRVEPDFAVGAAYKWLLGPYATGFLYAAPHRQDGRPLEENWINRDGSEDFSRLIDYRDAYAPGARRYDMGERSNHQLVPAALASLTYLGGLGIEAIAAHIAALNDKIADRLAPLGLADDTPDRAGHYLSLALPDDAPGDLAARLREHKVHVSQRGPRLRISPHVYNSDTDVDRLEAALRAVLS
ncbi:MAG: aminotransferase class V-fold PLP-dependent enzyme [Oceanicaulis sp.]